MALRGQIEWPRDDGYSGPIRGDAVVLAVVEQDVGVGDAGGRAIQIVDRQGPVRLAASGLPSATRCHPGLI